MLKRTCLNSAVMTGALADWGHSSRVVMSGQRSHASGSTNYYQNNRCLRTAGGRKSTFLLTRAWDHAANRALWRAVA